jgi:serine/threonine-protein kinase
VDAAVSDAPDVVPVRRGYTIVAVGCALTAALVPVLGRAGTPTTATAIGLATQALLAATLAGLGPAWGRLRLVGAIALAAPTALAGAFFGPNAAFAAALALVVLMLGLLTGDPAPARRALSRVGWITYAVLAGGQAVVVALVATGVVADASLGPIFVADLPRWHHLAAHVALQGMYLAAFLGGRAAQRRYLALGRDVADATRAAARHAALVAEARAEYLQAVAHAQRGLTSAAVGAAPGAPLAMPIVQLDEGAPATADSGTRAVVRNAPRAGSDGEARTADTQLLPEVLASATPGPTRPTRLPVDAPAFDDLAPEAGPVDPTAWRAAFRARMRGQQLFAVLLCAFGALTYQVVIVDAVAKWVAWATMAGIALASLADRALARESYGAWVVIGALSVGPAYALGLHSAFAVVIATLLFAGGLFRAGQPGARDPRWAVLAAVCASHGAVFALVWSHVLRDRGNVPLWQPGSPRLEPVLLHALVQAIYVVAFTAGRSIDRRFASLFARARAATAAAARGEARLAEVRARLDQALADDARGIFSGALIDGFRLGPLVGRGGMGEVYRAHREQDGAVVAFKLIRRDLAVSPISLERIAREAAILVSIASRHVARVVASGAPGGALPYIAMAFIDGASLHAVLRARTRLPADEVAALVDAVAAGLADVHAAGIVHLDVKPGNIVRAASTSSWTLVDFGIARSLTADHDRLDPDEQVAGTPTYMAPEHALGWPTDGRADVYSLGLVVYRALTGQPAFVGGDAEALALHALEHGPPDPRALVEAAVPDDVWLVLRLALAARAAQRLPSAIAAREAFAAAFAGHLAPALRAQAEAILAARPWA